MFASKMDLSNPKLPLLTERAINAIDLTLIKVVAHRQNPSQNPLPSDPKSLERAFNDVFAAIPKRKQDDAMAKFQSVLDPAERTRVYGDLGQVNFASSTSIVDQVKALPLPAGLKFTDADVADLNKQIMAKKLVGQALNNIGHNGNAVAGDAVAQQAIIGRPIRNAGHQGRGVAARAAVQQAVVASSMRFEIVSATCVKPNDARKDEINMAVGTVDGLGSPLNAGPFFVGKFKKGDTIALGAAGQLFNFKLDQTVFPASFPAFAFMIESDLIHNPDLANKLAIAFAITAVALDVIAGATIALALTGVVPAPAAVVVIIVSEIAAIAFAAAGTVVMPILADDISVASGDTLILEAAPAPGSVFERNITIGGFGTHARGQYNVLLRWSADL
jgi:hypothetical protein